MKCSVFAVPVALLCAMTVAGCSKNPEVEKKRFLENGNKQFASQHYREAIIEYQNVIRIDGRNAEARVKSAEAFEKLGDDASALREYVRAADLLPTDADIQAKAAEYLLAAGLVEDAGTRAQRAIDIKPSFVKARLLKAMATAGLKKLDSAVAQVEETIKMNPNEPSAFAQLGRFNLAQGNRSEAEKAFKSAYEVSPNSVDALLGLANFYMSTGLPEEAEQWLKKAMAVAPQDKRVTRTLGALYLQTNRLADAEAPLKAYAEAEPSAAAKFLLADYYFQMSRYDDSRRVLDAVKDRDDAYVEARRRLSIIEFVSGRLPEAQKVLEEGLARDPRNTQALLLKGRYLMFQGKNTDAVAALKLAVEADPKVAEAQYWLGVAYRNVGDPAAARLAFTAVQSLEPREAGAKLQLSQLSLAEGNADAALDFANQAVAAQPANPQARVVLIDALIAKNDLSAALSAATSLATGLPSSPQLQMQLGRIYSAQGKLDLAERAYSRASELSQGADDAVGALVNTRIRMGKLREARTLVDEALAKKPNSAPLHVYASRIAMAEKNVSGAERALQDALSADPSYLQAYVELTQIYFESGRLNEGRAQLEAIVAKQPKSVWPQTMIAMSLQLQNKKDEARERYRKILAIDPRAAIASNNLAMLYVEEGRNLDDARELAQTAVQQMPASPEVYDTLGSVYLKQSLPALAVGPFTTSVRTQPDNPTYHYHLGLALAQMGDKDKARESLRRALALGKQFEGVDDAKRLLATL